MEKHPEIRTGRLLLRPWRDGDLEPFAALNADARVMEFMPAPLTRQQSGAFAERIRAHFDEHACGLWAVELADAPFIGFIGLQRATFESPFTPAVEVGFRLSAEHWNNGYATEGAKAVIQWAFQHTDLDEIVSFTAVINRRSQRVIEKAGLVRDLQGDFDHPRVAEGHPLRAHVLYRIRRS